MASRFVHHFRNTFLVASTATLAQAIEPSISPRLRRLHYLGPQLPPPPLAPPLPHGHVTCQCGDILGHEALRPSAAAAVWRNSAAPLGVASSAVLAINASGPMGGPAGDKPPEPKESRGEPQNLRKVMHYFERVMPLMFDSRLFFLKYNPPQLYTPNVILENHLREPTKVVRGLPLLLLWQNMFRLNYTMRYVANRLVILNQWIDPDEGTVTINFRILCVRKLNQRGGVKPTEVDEALSKAFMEKAEWHDYLLTLHVTSYDRVWKLVITQKNAERTPPLKTRLVNPLLGLRRRVSQQEQELPMPV